MRYVKIMEAVLAALIVAVICSCAVVLTWTIWGATDERTIPLSRAISEGVVMLDTDDNIVWIKPEVKIVEVERQVIVKVPTVQIVEVEIPKSITMEEFKRAIIEDRHEQTLREAELNDFFGEDIDSVGDVTVEEIKDVDKVKENKQSFFGRLFNRSKNTSK